MIEATTLDKVKVLLGISDNTKNSLIEMLIEQAEMEFLQYCHIEEIPRGAANIIVDMTIVKYNLLGTEGLSNQSYSGVSEAYEHYSPQLLKAMNRYRKLILL